MTTKPFSLRYFFLPAFLLILALAVYACGAAMPATEEPSAPEEPAATEMPAEEEPASEPDPGDDSPTTFPTQMAVSPTQSAATPQPLPTEIPVQPAILETRRLTLEYPPRMKAGVESDVIRLTLEVDDLGNITPTAQFENNAVTGEVVEIPDLYETHIITAEARLDMAGMTVVPPGVTYQPMKRGESVTFYWSIRPQETGRYRGTVWLHLGFVDRVSGEESRMAVSAQIVEIEAVDLFGFSVSFVRTSGVVGSALGFIIGLPFFDDILKFLFRRRRKRKASR
jgi:hypothetical protein